MTTAGPLDLLRELWSAGVHLVTIAKAVITCLILHRNNSTGACYPSVTTIARETGLSRRSVSGWINALEQLGVIQVQRRQGCHNRYQIDLTKAPTSASDALVQQVHQCNTRTGPVHDVHGTSATGAPELLSNYEGTANTHTSESPDVRFFFDEWNVIAAECGLTRCTKVSDPRLRGARARLDDHGEDGLRRALAEVRRSRYLRGEVNGWRASLDWLLKPANMLKVLEGNYRDTKTPPAAQSVRTPGRDYNVAMVGDENAH